MFNSSEIHDFMIEEMERDNGAANRSKIHLGNHGYQTVVAKTPDGTYEELLEQLMEYDG